VLLIDTKTGYRFLDEWKTDLWNTAAIPSPAGDSETNEAIVFGYLVACSWRGTQYGHII